MTDNSKTSKEMQIKSGGWHKVTLTGDLMTGDTFTIKDWIKKYLNGQWDGQRKGWMVDLAAVAKYSSADGSSLMVR
jgi:hypothetical protein